MKNAHNSLHITPNAFIIFFVGN